MQTIRYQIIISVFLLFLNHTVLAKKECDKSDWRCHDDYALSIGYIYSYQCFPNQRQTLAIPGHPSFDYNIKQSLPNNYSGIRLGFESGLGHDSSFGFQFYYTQVPPKSNTYNDFQFTGKGKEFLSILEYTINPKSRTKVGLIAGTGVISSYLSIKSVNPKIVFSTTANVVDVDPILGAHIGYQINSTFELNFIYFYDFATFNPNLYGRSVPALMLRYYPPL